MECTFCTCILFFFGPVCAYVMRGRTQCIGRQGERRKGGGEREGRKVERGGRNEKRGGRKEKRDGRMDKHNPCPPLCFTILVLPVLLDEEY